MTDTNNLAYTLAVLWNTNQRELALHIAQRNEEESRT